MSSPNDFSGIPFPHSKQVELALKEATSSAFLSLSHFVTLYPHVPQLWFQLGDLACGLLDYPKALSYYKKAYELDPTLIDLERLIKSLSGFLSNEIAKIKAEEDKALLLDQSLVFHRWSPIEPLPSNLRATQHTSALNKEGWLQVKSNPQLLEKLKRLWSIETGRIENLYQFDEGVTKSLISLGFLAGLIPHEETGVDVTKILQDQLLVIEMVLDRVGTKNETITVEFLHQLQESFTAHSRFTKVVAEGRTCQALIRRGEFKMYPNSPTRTDKLIHQYCPPSKVAEEVDRLLAFYTEYKEDRTLDPVVLSAWLHHRFVQIHPYMDGNGRVARTIASIPLLRAGLPPIVILSTFRATYISALQQADQESDLEPLIKVIIDSINSALQDVLA